MAKLGTRKRPAAVRLRSTEEAEEIVGLAQERGWRVIVGVEPDQVEDPSDIRKLLHDEVKPEDKPRLPPADPDGQKTRRDFVLPEAPFSSHFRMTLPPGQIAADCRAPRPQGSEPTPL